MYCGIDSSVMLKPPGVIPGTGDSNGHFKVPGIESFYWECEHGTAICGIKTANFNPNPATTADDDVSLTGVKFKCCKLP